MKARNLILSALFIIGSLFILSSCEKDDDEMVTISQAEEMSFLDNLFEEVANDVDNAAVVEPNTKNGGEPVFEGGAPFGGCATVTIEYPEDTSFPRIITIDFGEEGCTIIRNDEEITKSGKIVTEITAPHFIEGSTKTTTFVDFYVNGNKIEGTRIGKNEGKNQDGYLVFKEEIKDGKITTAEGQVMQRNHLRIRTMIEGLLTPKDPKDDVFTIEGSGNGVNSDGKTCEHQITTPLMHIRNCPWFVSGTITGTFGDDNVVIDFGDGTCDNLATKTVNGETKEFELKRKYHKRKGQKKQGNH